MILVYYVSWCPSKCWGTSALLNLEYTLDRRRLKSQAPIKTDKNCINSYLKKKV